MTKNTRILIVKSMRRPRRIIAVSLFIVSLSSVSIDVTQAAPFEVRQTLLSPTPCVLCIFGYSVALAGEKIVIAEPGDNTAGPRAGAVHIFDAKTGQLFKTLLNPTPGFGDWFGFSVAALNGKVLVGAPYDDTKEIGAGTVYVFDSETGELTMTLRNPAPSQSEHFGSSVAFVQSGILVGAPFHHSGKRGGGAAYLFDGETGRLMRIFRNPTPDIGDWFGWSVGGIGENILIGDPSDDTRVENAGAVYLFDGHTGRLSRTFFDPFPGIADEFGRSVTSTGDLVLVGAPFDGTGIKPGTAFLFDGNTGELVRSFRNPTPADGDLFGFSLSILDDEIIISAHAEDRLAGNTGAVYVFDLNTGAMLQTLNNPTPDPADLFGFSVASAAGTIVIGAIEDSTNGFHVGAAYVFRQPLAVRSPPA